MSIASISSANGSRAPIERVAIPLQPRLPSGCCDLAVMFYGRYLGPALRLWLAVAGPAVAFVYGFGRFVGTDLSLAIVTAVIVSKQLGLLTVAATVRATFGESFERPKADGDPRTGTARLTAVSWGLVSVMATVAAGFLIAATLDDAYGTGRLAALGAERAGAIVLIATAALLLRAQVFIARRHAPTRPVRNGIVLGTLVRLLLAAPLVMLFFDQTWALGVGLAIFWLPGAAALALRRSFHAERRALAEIDPALHTPQANAALSFNDMAGPAFTVTTAAVGLSLVALSAIEFAFTTAGLAGPISGPAGDSFDFEFFEPGFAFTALGRSPLFAASALAAGLFAYQLGRIAWYFAYLDARVRRDCWDMELLLAREAKRLEGE